MLICQDAQSGVLILADGTRRSHWPARVLANDVGMSIDRPQRTIDCMRVGTSGSTQQHYKHARIPGSYPDVLATVVSGGSGRTGSLGWLDRRKVFWDGKKRASRQIAVVREK